MENLFPPTIGEYSFAGILGHGTFSIVALAVKTKTNEYYACKIVPKLIISANSLEERFENEIRIHQQLHHIGVVQIVDLHKDDRNYYIFMEYCPNGDFFQFIIENNTLSEPLASYCMVQILEALKYLHNLGIAHRDMKPENILIDANGHLKISDFGLSRYVGNGGLVSTPCGSPCYASPECLSGYPYDGKTNDIWSCGVILYASLTGSMPWTKRNQKQLFDQIRHGDYKVPETFSPECQSLIKRFLTVDLTARITIDQALQHPFLKNVEKSMNNQVNLFPLISIKKVDDFLGYSDDNEIVSKNELFRSESSAEDGFNKVLKQIDSVDIRHNFHKSNQNQSKQTNQSKIDHKIKQRSSSTNHKNIYKQKNTIDKLNAEPQRGDIRYTRKPTNVLTSQSLQGSLRPLPMPKNTKKSLSVMKPGILHQHPYIVKPSLI
ncbi:hypothetical protein M9Y10_037427 [Tritrichomonas musculus]|uniref:Protein kinase domain-containing protein n=1 Tax=Tritrichomonas musculus TaxID=1915356 RepID=A0ABR2GTB6_9EUKA